MDLYHREYSVDVVLCIDISASMRPHLDEVKSLAVKIIKEFLEYVHRIHQNIVVLFRAKCITFGTYGSHWQNAVEESRFFDLSGEFGAFQECMEQIACREVLPDAVGRAGLEALACAIRTEWRTQESSWIRRNRQTIILFSDEAPAPLEYGRKVAGYPQAMPSSMGEMGEWWAQHPSAPGAFTDFDSERLVLFAPDAGGWKQISDNWHNVIHFPSLAGRGLRELDFKEILYVLADADSAIYTVAAPRDITPSIDDATLQVRTEQNTNHDGTNKEENERKENKMASNYSAQTEYDVDLVFCIDATGSMRRVLDIVKQNALKFHGDIVTAMQKKDKKISELRVRVVAFRDYLDNYKDAMMVTDFFTLPQDNALFKQAVSSLEPIGGGDDAEDGLEALAYAIKSPWKRGDHKARQVIALWTDAEPHPLGFGASAVGYPKNAPKTVEELGDWWAQYPGAPGAFTDFDSERLILFAPDAGGWKQISDNWQNVVHFPSQAGRGLRELDYTEILNAIVNSVVARPDSSNY